MLPPVLFHAIRPHRKHFGAANQLTAHPRHCIMACGHTPDTRSPPSPFLSYPHFTHRPLALLRARLHRPTPPVTAHTNPPHAAEFATNFHQSTISGILGIPAPKLVRSPSATPSRHRPLGTT